MIYPTQAIINAIIVGAYAIQSLHQLLLKAFNYFVEVYKNFMETQGITVTLHFHNSEPVV